VSCEVAGHDQVAEQGFWRTIIGHRYLKLIALLLLLAQMIEPLVEYQFMSVVEAAYQQRELRTAYLGQFFSMLSGVAIAVNLLVTPLILRCCGPIFGLAAQPLAVVAGSLYMLWSPGLNAASVLKIADRGLSYSINRASKELLYIPIDALLIFQAKAWIDMFGYRLFRVLGSVMILLLTQWLWFEVPDAAIGVLTLTCCFLWFALLFRLRREYRVVSQG